MPSDRELAAAKLPGSALAVALAVRALTAEGITPTVPKVMDLTGYGKSQVYEARLELRRRWPDEYPEGPATPVTWEFPDYRTPHSGTPDPPPEDRTPARRLDKAALLLPGTDVVPAPATGLAPWRTALAEVVVPMEGQRSWDAYTVYSQAWDLIPDLIPADDDPAADAALVVGNQIALAIDFVRRMGDGLGLEVENGLIAMLVRQFGKASLYGLNKALGVTDELTTRDLYRYARATAANVVADLGAQP